VTRYFGVLVFPRFGIWQWVSLKKSSGWKMYHEHVCATHSSSGLAFLACLIGGNFA